MFTAIPQLIIGAVDLVAAFLFLYGLKRMSSPVTAPSGIFVAGLGMLVAILASFLYVFSVDAAARPFLPVNIGLAIIALIVGGGAAWWSGRKVAIDRHAADGRALQRPWAAAPPGRLPRWNCSATKPRARHSLS